MGHTCVKHAFIRLMLLNLVRLRKAIQEQETIPRINILWARGGVISVQSSFLNWFGKAEL
jgi:hypothetical protein